MKHLRLSFLLLLLWGFTAQSAPVFDAAASDLCSASNPSIATHTSTGADRFALLGIYTEGGVSIVTITYGAQTPTLIHSHSKGGFWLYGLDDPATGGQTVTVTFSGAPSRCAVGILSYTGVGTTGTAAEATVDATTLSVDVASAAGQLVVDVALFSEATIVVGASQTARIDLDNFESTFRSFGMSEEAGATTTTMSWTTGASTDGWSIGVSLTAAGGGGSTVPVKFHHYSEMKK